MALVRDVSKDGETRAAARIKVIGVGGGGVNAVRRMLPHRVPGVDYICVNTDVKSLDKVDGALTIQIGESLTHGWGAGGNPNVGEAAADEGRVLLKKAVKDAELIFITVGMGGGTGTGAAPVVARLAKESTALTVAVATTPFSFEGAKRMDTALHGIHRLRPEVDNIIVVHNDRLLQFCEHDASMDNAFKLADEVVTQGILSVSELVNVPGQINVDLADVKAVMGIAGTALMAIGEGDGARGAVDAAEQAISNPLLDMSIKGAKGVLFSVAGGPDLTLGAVNAAGEAIANEVDKAALIFFGMMNSEDEMEGKCKLTLVATGIRNHVNGNGEGLGFGAALKSFTPGFQFKISPPSFLRPKRR